MKPNTVWTGLVRLLDWRAGLFILAFAIPLLGGLDEMQQAIGGPDKVAKPQPPLSVRMSLLNSPAVGQEAVVDFEVKTLVDALAVRISFDLPSGLRMTGGSKVVAGKMSKGKTKHFQIRFVVSEKKAYEIIGTAAVEFSDGSKVSRVSSLKVNLG